MTEWTDRHQTRDANRRIIIIRALNFQICRVHSKTISQRRDLDFFLGGGAEKGGQFTVA